MRNRSLKAQASLQAAYDARAIARELFALSGPDAFSKVLPGVRTQSAAIDDNVVTISLSNGRSFYIVVEPCQPE